MRTTAKAGDGGDRIIRAETMAAKVEMADLARYIYSGYPEAAQRYRQDCEALATIRATPRLAEHEADAMYNAKCRSKTCSEYAWALGDVANLVAEHLSELWPDLRLVAPSVRWHDDPAFDWAAAKKELRTIEAAALVAERAALDDGEPTEPADPKKKIDDARTTQKKPSRCPRGMAHEYILNYLCGHHRFDGERVEWWPPLAIPEIAKKAGVAAGTASAWFKEHFGSHDLYKAACNRRDNGPLASTLRSLRGETTSFIDPAGLIENQADQGASDLVHDLDDPREAWGDPDELYDVQ